MWLIDAISRTEIERAVFAAAHSIWVGGVLGVLLWVCLRWVPARRTGSRYAMALGALLLVVLSSPAAYAVLSRERASEVPVATAAGEGRSYMNAAAISPVPSSGHTGPAAAGGEIDWVAIAGWLWAAGFAAMLVRMALQLRGARRLMAGAEDASHTPAGAAVMRLQERLNWRRTIRVLLVPRLISPAIVGVFRPALLIPPAIACDLTPQQFESILLHELAHIRRHDYLVNIAQLLIEAILFFNPAVWFISRQVRIEREACCDAFAALTTGEPVRYAETLGMVMHRLVDAAAPAPAALAVSGQGRGAVLDRVRRLLVPGYRPGLRLSGPMLTGMVLAGLLLFAGLWQATGTAVAAAAEWMSDAQRVEKIAEVQKETQKESAQGQATVAGQIVTEDGSPLPEIGYVSAHVTSQQGSTGKSLSARNGQFRSQVPSGTVRVSVMPKGYALAAWGPQVIKPGEVRDDIKLVLSKGITGKVRITEADGEPVANAEITVTHVLRSGTSTDWLGSTKEVTDDTGLLTIPAVGRFPVSLTAEVPGYQAMSAEFDLSDGKEPTWQLVRAKVITGRVTAQADGKPVANARIVKMHESGAGSSGWHPMQDDAPVLARTDAEGQFTVDTLNDASIYNLAVIADGYTPKLIYDFAASKGTLDVGLPPALHVRGKVLGTPEQLARFLGRRDKPQIVWSSTVMVARNSGWGSSFYSSARIVGSEASFEISGFVPGELYIGDGPGGVRVDATKNVDDLVIDLREGSPARPQIKTREVQVRIKVPQGAPPAQGMIDVVAFNPKGAMRYMETMQTKVESGVAKCSLPVGKPFRYESGKLAGYWFNRNASEPELILPEGDGPYVLEVEARPAGAVYGVVYDADGKPLASGFVSLITVQELAQRPPDFPQLQPAQTGPDGKFLITPVLLGGKYRICACGQTRDVGDQHVLGDVITVTGAQPLAQSDLRFVKGIDISAQVVDEQGRPIASAEVHPSLNTAWSHGFGMVDRRTDGQGRFILGNLAPNWPGKLSVAVQPLRDFAARNVELKIGTQEQTIVLVRGLSFSGRVVDDQTGQPVPLVTIRLSPQNGAGDAPWIEVRTDDKGEFTVSTLQRATYSVYLDDCYSPGTTFEPAATGSYSIKGDQNFAPVDPRTEKQRDFRVVVAPWHGKR